MTDLTDKWKKGELPSGEYYIIDDLGLHTTDRYYPSHGFGAELPQSVLGRVPSYDEWQAKLEENAQLKEQINKWCLDAINRGTANTVKAVKEFGMPERIEELVKQNAQLKELLKECKDYLPEFETPMNILAKIDEALR